MDDDKLIHWVGSSYADLLAFPAAPRREAGFSSARCRPVWNPRIGSRSMIVGAGTKEIRIEDAQGICRVMYVAKFEEAIDVLHCSQKQTQATSKHDKTIAETRYRAIANARRKAT